MSYFERPSSFILYAIGNDLTAWRNGDAKLITAELKAIDNLLSMSNIGVPKIQTTTKTPVGYKRHERTLIKKAKANGEFRANFEFQTGRILNWILQECSTTEDTPSGYNTHDITIKDGQTPQNIALHTQREVTTDNLRYDLLGLIPLDYKLAGSEEGDFEQEIGFNVAKVLSSGTDDITKPSKCSDQNFNWNHLMLGGITKTYGGSAMGFDATGLEINFTNTGWMGVKDSGGLSTVAKNKKFDYKLMLTAKPKDSGESLYTISKTDYSDYTAGGIDIALKFARNATNDYVQFTYSNMMLEPLDEAIADEDQQFEQYDLMFVPGDDSTLAVKIVDSYNNDHYENPA